MTEPVRYKILKGPSLLQLMLALVERKEFNFTLENDWPVPGEMPVRIGSLLTVEVESENSDPDEFRCSWNLTGFVLGNGPDPKANQIGFSAYYNTKTRSGTFVFGS